MGRLTHLGILGGTFDPIHIGHLLVAQTAREALGLEKVLFVPAGRAPHRQPKDAASAEARLAMVQAAIDGELSFAISSVDLDRQPPQYTADTLAILRERSGLDADHLHFIVGSDSLATLPTWYRPDLVLTRCRLAVTCRPGHPIDLAELVRRVPQAAGRVDVVEMPAVGISSTLLRDMVRQGRSIRYWVPAAVERLVYQEGLYRQAPQAASTPASRCE